jgi:hypothetical protein
MVTSAPVLERGDFAVQERDVSAADALVGVGQRWALLSKSDRSPVLFFVVRMRDGDWRCADALGRACSWPQPCEHVKAAQATLSPAVA